MIHVVNSTLDYKAVKVRVLEAQNSQEVLDFNLYLSPEDHFSFVIGEAPANEVGQGEGAYLEGGAKLSTNDKSCTSPAIPDSGAPFRNIKFKTDDNNGVERNQVGYIEVIEMGQLDPNAAPKIDEAGSPTAPR